MFGPGSVVLALLFLLLTEGSEALGVALLGPPLVLLAHVIALVAAITSVWTVRSVRMPVAVYALVVYLAGFVVLVLVLARMS